MELTSSSSILMEERKWLRPRKKDKNHGQHKHNSVLCVKTLRQKPTDHKSSAYGDNRYVKHAIESYQMHIVMRQEINCIVSFPKCKK